MADPVQTELTPELVNLLQGEKIVTVHTADHETGAPNVTAISWLLAINSTLLRFAIDPRSRVVANLQKDDRIVITLFGAGSIFSVAGHANVDLTQLDGVSIKMIQVEVHIKEVRDIMFYGGKLTVEPGYEKTYDPKLAEKFDREVYTSLGKA